MQPPPMKISLFPLAAVGLAVTGYVHARAVYTFSLGFSTPRTVKRILAIVAAGFLTLTTPGPHGGQAARAKRPWLGATPSRS